MVTPEEIFAGNSEMGVLMRSLDWSQTPLGAVETWSQSLRSTLSICLNSRFPIAIYWGADFLLLYNDAWRPIVGNKHPWAIGRPAREVWSEIWDEIGPELAGVVATGEGTFHNDELLSMHRFGYTEECFFEYTFNPIQGQRGVVDGVFNVVSETTYRVLNERRARLLRETAAKTGVAKTIEESCALMAEALKSDPFDLPFALLYLVDSNGESARLCGSTELLQDSRICPERVNLTTEASDFWEIARVARTAKTQEINNLIDRFGEIPGSPWSESPQEAMVLPIVAAGQDKVTGVLVAVASPRRRLDDNYRDFFNQVATQFASTITNAQAYEAERQRAEALAELDRAKTTFFSNISHEFRTPLTLMLSPLEELSNSLNGQLQPEQWEQLQLIQRNGLRLQKLVNTLLDFSRIEAGRVQASYEPTDLAAYTAELASVFRSLIEQAGMALVIDCPALPEPVYVDRDMWEKIVLNLISNAFKFTFTGSITVRLQSAGNFVELSVTDTGVGIPEAELPRLFERFHRVSGTRSRTYEGSGIGLALVQELVRLHGGTIHVTSQVDCGTTFTISLPFGTQHLPKDRIEASRTFTSTTIGTAPYIEEASRWITESSKSPVSSLELNPELKLRTSKSKPKTSQTAHILLADDNADMRDYVERLLSQDYEVEAVNDGFAALEAMTQQIPDLVLSDVMMPGLDGFGLLRELRADPCTKEIPVILLSARAGEEARIEGLEAGADDYLIKPFSARELLARVESTLKLTQIRQQAETAIREREERLKLAVEAGRMIAWEWNPFTETIFSTNLSEIYGIDTIDSSQQGFTLVHLEDQAQHQSIVENAVANGKNYQSEFRFIRPDTGETAWMEERGRAVLNEDGSLQKLIGVTIDITDRKRAEAQLRKSETFLQAVNETAPNLLYIFDLTERRNVYISPQIFPMLGISSADVQALDSQLLVELFHPDDLEQIEQHHDRIRAAQEDDIFTIEYRMKHASGRWIWLSSRDKIFVRDEQGNPTQILGSAIDITDRKRTEEDLRRSEAAFRTISNATPALVWVAAPDGSIIFFNDRWYEFTGQTEAEALGLGWAETMHPNDAARILPYWNHCQHTGETYEGEVRYRRHDGEYCWHTFRALARRNTNGEIEAWYGLSIDISDRKNAEQERERFLALGADFQVITSINGYFRWVSPSFKQLLGWTQAEMTSRPWTDFVHPDDINPSVSETDSLFSGNETFAFENRYRHKDGSYRWLLWNAQLYPDKGVIYGSAIDITDRKQAETALQESEELKRRILESSQDCIKVLTLEGRLLYINSGGLNLLGLDEPASILNAQWLDFWQDDDRLRAEAALAAAKAGSTGQLQGCCPTIEGNLKWWDVILTPIRDASGRVAQLLAISRDITKQKQAESEREQLLKREQVAREEAERANRIRDEFLAVLSHELRSPLNPILGWSRLLLNGKLDESRTKQALVTIERNAKLQSELIEDLLDISRILQGKLRLTVNPVNLASTIQSAIETVQLAAEAKSIAIETKLDTAVGLVSGDSTRLQQIVWNILSNAVKFTPIKGQVTVQLKQVNDHAQITVCDTGKGISPDFLPYVFDYFRQEDGATTRKFGGLGLGLAIVRHLVELHGGTVRADSLGEGQGATFTIRLPLLHTPLQANQDERSLQQSLSLSGIKILVVDDETDTRELVAFVLEQQGAQVITATSAHEALLVLHQAKPDVLVSDIGMPEMDGYMLIQQVRLLTSEQGGQIPAIALTAYAGDINKQQVLAAGFQKHISKPLELDVLVQEIAGLARST